MTDYSPQVDQLNEAAQICQHHVIKPVTGETYPRWPEAWAACEVVWRNYLDMHTMDGSDDEKDRRTVNLEAKRLK